MKVFQTEAASNGNVRGTRQAVDQHFESYSAGNLERQVLRLQRSHGNQFVQRVMTVARETASEAAVHPLTEALIERNRGGGRALDSKTRTQMESAFGADFGSVRIHTGTESDSLNRAVNAIAFTTGQDVFFRNGAYNPGDSGGRELLAHELTHVVQQSGGSTLRGKLTVGEPNGEYEREADRVAESVTATINQRADDRDEAPVRRALLEHL